MLKNEASKICFECNVINHFIKILKPLRSKHCEICQTCVMVFDHNCPWINNCVGAGNYLYFFLYIITIEINLIFVFIYSILRKYKLIKFSVRNRPGMICIQ